MKFLFLLSLHVFSTLTYASGCSIIAGYLPRFGGHIVTEGTLKIEKALKYDEVLFQANTKNWQECFDMAEEFASQKLDYTAFRSPDPGKLAKMDLGVNLIEWRYTNTFFNGEAIGQVNRFTKQFGHAQKGWQVYNQQGDLISKKPEGSTPSVVKY